MNNGAFTSKFEWDKKIILERDNYTCSYCGCKVSFDDSHIDHIVARSKSGSTIFENLTTSCIRCNLLKHDLTLNEFYIKSAKKYRQAKDDSDYFLKIMKNIKKDSFMHEEL